MIASKRFLLLFCCVLLLAGIQTAQARQIQTGGLMFVGFNADSLDGFALVAIVDIPVNSTIYISDNEWNGQSIGAGGAFDDNIEGIMIWENGATQVDAGTVVIFQYTRDATEKRVSVGTISGTTIAIAGDDEVLYVYQGTDGNTPTSFITAFANDNFSALGATPNKGRIAGTGLTNGQNALGFSGGLDVIVYQRNPPTPQTCNGTLLECKTQFATRGNFNSQNGDGNQHQDKISPDFIADLPTGFTGSTLPVSLVSFTGVASDAFTTLSWITASEQDNSHFVVEQSADGLLYEEVTTVEGNGTTTLQSSYGIDVPNMIFNRSAYYRLSQYDLDGTSEVLSTIYVENRNTSAGFMVYPNPATGEKIQAMLPSNASKAYVASADGRVLASVSPAELVSGYDITRYHPGIYLLVYSVPEGNKSMRFVISK